MAHYAKGVAVSCPMISGASPWGDWMNRSLSPLQ